MAKKKNKTVELKLVLKCLGLLLGIGAVLFGLLNCVKFTGKVLGTESYLTGFQIMFGYAEPHVLGGGETVYSTFSFMALLSYLLPLAGGVLLIFKNKILNFASIACFVIGAVLLFLMPSFVITEFFVADAYTSALAVGAILSAVSSILGALTAVYVTLTK